MDTAPLLAHRLKFDPPKGLDFWPRVEEWKDATWSHWLRGHNKYPFLTQWSEPAILQYLNIDRYRYGLGFTRAHGIQTRTDWFYQPTPIAVPFHSTKVPNILFGGAAGGSKSHSARWDALRHCFAIPEFRAIIMRRTMTELQRNHLDRVHSEAIRLSQYWQKHQKGGHDIVRYNKNDKELVVDVHGPGRESKIVFGHCQHLGDEENYLGDAYDAFYPDEMATFDKSQIIGVAGRLRSEKYINGKKLNPRMGGTSNPKGAATLWLKQWFIDRDGDQIREEENPAYDEAEYTFLPAMLYDNPYYMDPDGSYKRYENRLFAYDPERRRQLLLGDWTALTGQFFPEFSTRTHVEALDVPQGVKIERWIDWGYDPGYGVVLWAACLPSGRLYVFYEWRFNGATSPQKLVASEVAKKIKDLTLNEVLPIARGRRISKSVGDPSMWMTSGHTGEDTAATFARSGCAMIQADNDRPMGWSRLRHWLRDAPDGHPWLMIHPRCSTLIRTLPGLVRDDNDPDDVDTEGEDHAADALRYGVMARPSPTKFKQASLVIPELDLRQVMDALRSRSVTAGRVA